MCLLKQKKKNKDNVKVALRLPWRLRLSLSLSFFLYFYAKHSRKLTLNSALILSRRSPTLARLFLSLDCICFCFLTQFVNFIILNCLLGLLWFHGKKSFWIGLDLNSTRSYVRQASSASLSASRLFFFFSFV